MRKRASLHEFNGMLMTGPQIADEVGRQIGYFVWGGKLMYSHFILERNLAGIPESQLEAMKDKARELRQKWEADNAAVLREWREKERKASAKAERTPAAKIPIVGMPNDLINTIGG